MIARDKRSSLFCIKMREKGLKNGAIFNEGISAASFCHQVAAWFPDMFCNFYFVKIHKITKNSTTTKTREKMIADMESLEF